MTLETQLYTEIGERIMTLENALFDFSEKLLREGTDWYDWAFNWKRLPPGIREPDGNCYEKNVALKKALTEDWQKNGDATRRQELERFYIVVFGGVRTNAPETLNEYFSNTDAQNIARGSQGIASWSKALTVRDFKRYAIYDARVAAALTALQIIYRVSKPQRFPLLPSRNRLIAESTPALKQWARDKRWAACSPSFYEDYLALCRTTASRLKSEGNNPDAEIYSIEMMLFAHAEQLVKDAVKAN